MARTTTRTGQGKSPRKESFFPFGELRSGQRELFYEVWDTLEAGKNLVAHAPTGIGKTVAALAPAVHYGLEKNRKVFFLTPKQSQHTIAVETMKLIEERSGRSIKVCDIIAKQAMCPRDIAEYHQLLFHHLCALESASKRCPYLMNKNDEAVDTILDRIHHVDEAKDVCCDSRVCPHATLLKAAKSADVVICDYNYFFSDMQERAMERLGCSLGDIILIVDEGHNLPDRIRAQLSDRLTNNRLKDSLSELRPIDGQLTLHLKLIMEQLDEAFKKYAQEAEEGQDEMNIPKSELVRMVTRSLKQSVVGKMGYYDFVNKLKTIGTKLSKDSGSESATLRVAEFFDGWMKGGTNCSRILSFKGTPQVSFNLLDPSFISTPVFENVHASVVMSGTLYPSEMFKDILGIPRAVCRAYKSPFPKENKKVLVTEGLTSKYTARGEGMYGKIADTISTIANEIFENVAVFFPSYNFMMFVRGHYENHPYWNLYLEKQKMTKKEKRYLYDQLFKNTKAKKAMLWGVQAGSLSEGIDYEENILKAVIVVGLPLSPPSLEVNNLVGYYSQKFGKTKGQLYGYTYPALSKVIQAAGRGIRSEKDYGMVVLMDYRFKQPRYRKYFPDDFDFVVTSEPERECREFFKKFK